MKKTKVIQFIAAIADGGAETLVKDYCLMLDKERFEVKEIGLMKYFSGKKIRCCFVSF